VGLFLFLSLLLNVGVWLTRSHSQKHLPPRPLFSDRTIEYGIGRYVKWGGPRKFVDHEYNYVLLEEEHNILLLVDAGSEFRWSKTIVQSTPFEVELIISDKPRRWMGFEPAPNTGYYLTAGQDLISFPLTPEAVSRIKSQFGESECLWRVDDLKVFLPQVGVDVPTTCPALSEGGDTTVPAVPHATKPSAR